MILRMTFAKLLALGLIGSAVPFTAHSQSSAQASAKEAALAVAEAQAAAQASAAQPKGKKVKQGKPAKQGKNVYTGPTTVVVLPPKPVLDDEGNQRVDPDGKLMFDTPVQQIRDKKGHPVFDGAGKPVFQTASNMGYDEKGKKIEVKKQKPPKMTPVSIRAGTLTVDGWTGKARMNYDIADLKYLYLYAPGIGTTIVSQNPFPGATEQAGAFNGNSLKVTVDGHPIELSSDKPLLGNKSQPAWVMVDRGFMLPAKFPVFGYGTTARAPYTWPGAKGTVEATGPLQPPPLPPELMPRLLLGPCPSGMMRRAAPAALPGQKAPDEPCVPIRTSPAAAKDGAATPAASSEANSTGSPAH